MLARTRKLGLVLTLTTLAAVACDDDPVGVTPPTEEEVAGTYAASDALGVFTTEVDEETTDHLAEGATITVVLAADGTASGSIFVPDWDEGDLEADLDGTWTLDGFTVTLEIDAGTFLDELELTWAEGGLSASGTLEGDVTFELELESEED
jgi:hypothetical protein